MFYGAKQAKQVVLGRFSRCELGMMVPVVDMNWVSAGSTAPSSHKELFPMLSVNNKAFPIPAFFKVLCVVPSYLLICAGLRENKVKTCRAYCDKTATILMGEANIL